MARHVIRRGNSVPSMHQIAQDVFMISVLPRCGINAYLIGDVLVDSGIKQTAKKLLGELKGRPVGTHALTHAHYDHAGGSRRVVAPPAARVGAPAGDAAEVESGKPVLADTR